MPSRPFSRRIVLNVGLFLGASVLAGRAFGADVIGIAVRLRGQGVLTRSSTPHALQVNDPLMDGDTVATSSASYAELMLHTRTTINLGPDSTFGIDRFVADLGGVIDIGGTIVFDRPDDLAPIDLTLRSTFAQIGVRGTRFFAGPSNGAFAVFVERGRVSVTAAGETRDLLAGDGVDIATAGGPPGGVVRWGEARIAAAFASAGL
ncbi:MAG: FecR domain-containing protein [Gemmobacter sp.]|nr:FecR domain-containing protein [Gemmobacter sp.]